MKAALADYEVFSGDYYAGAPEADQVKTEKKPFNFPQMLDRLFGNAKDKKESPSR